MWCSVTSLLCDWQVLRQHHWCTGDDGWWWQDQSGAYRSIDQTHRDERGCECFPCNPGCCFFFGVYVSVCPCDLAKSGTDGESPVKQQHVGMKCVLIGLLSRCSPLLSSPLLNWCEMNFSLYLWDCFCPQSALLCGKNNRHMCHMIAEICQRGWDKSLQTGGSFWYLSFNTTFSSFSYHYIFIPNMDKIGLNSQIWEV